MANIFDSTLSKANILSTDCMFGPKEILKSGKLVPTNVKFPCPIYLEPDTEYCFVVGSPFNTYQVFTAEILNTDKKTAVTCCSRKCL